MDGDDDDNNSNNVKNYNMAAIMTIINREIFSMRMRGHTNPVISKVNGGRQVHLYFF